MLYLERRRLFFSASGVGCCRVRCFGDDPGLSFSHSNTRPLSQQWFAVYSRCRLDESCEDGAMIMSRKCLCLALTGSIKFILTSDVQPSNINIIYMNTIINLGRQREIAEHEFT
jgi:hypothetical protein